MLPVTIAEVAKVIDAALIQGDPARMVTAVVTDSRNAAGGDLFFALQGDRFDGHEFVSEAVARGAVGAVVSRTLPSLSAGAAVLMVPDVPAALGKLAGYVRKRSGVFLIGVTGSTGKTSTKDILSAILGARFRVLATRGNLNNEIGVPLTLLDICPGHEVAVVEMAMRAPGEIAALARITCPNAAVITNIGETHLERLGSIRAIANAKGEVLEFIPAEGFAVLHAESPFIHDQVGRCKGRVLFFGTGGGAAVQLVNYTPENEGSRFRVAVEGAEEEYFLPVPGYHNAINALAAIAVAREMGLCPDEIREGLRRVELSGMRLEIKRCGSLTVINDSYNASPASMRAALSVLQEVARGRRRVAVLGDMLELGERTGGAHREVGEAAAGSADFVVAVGESAKDIAAGAVAAGLPVDRVIACPDAARAAEFLTGMALSEAVVLVKASRGIHLETVVEALCSGGGKR